MAVRNHSLVRERLSIASHCCELCTGRNEKDQNAFSKRFEEADDDGLRQDLRQEMRHESRRRRRSREENTEKVKKEIMI